VKRHLVAVAAGLVLGNIPSADVAAKLARGSGLDLRDVGSSNPGAMNAAKTLGSGWGAAVLVADVGKGVFAAAVGRRAAGSLGANLASTAAVIGHCYPVGRSGGKGVSTSIGQVIGTFPAYLPLDVAVGLATAALPRWTQRTWAATAATAAVWVSSATVAYRRGWSTGIDSPAPLSLPITAALSSAVIAKRFLDTPLIDGKPQDDERVGGPDQEAK
jgi:glycerol-3-phosphate acyltransferase PlsY